MADFFEEDGCTAYRLTTDAMRAMNAFDASGGRYTVSREQAQAEVRTLINLMHDIPADLAKTAQGIREQTRRTTEDFMQDERPVGEIMGAYLKESREMFVGTEEGRSFLTEALRALAPHAQKSSQEVLQTHRHIEKHVGEVTLKS